MTEHPPTEQHPNVITELAGARATKATATVDEDLRAWPQASTPAGDRREAAHPRLRRPVRSTWQPVD